MGFAGNLRTLSLPEVVQTLARIQATGVLRLASSAGGRDIIFKDGTIIGVVVREGVEKQILLQRMIMQGVIDASAAAAISASGAETNIVRSLVEQELVTEAEVLDARRQHTEEELHDICTWDSADFVFHDVGPDADEINEAVGRMGRFGMSFNTNSLLMEAARRMDEWSRLQERIPDGGFVLGVANGQDEALALAGAEFPASAVVPFIDAMRTVDDIVKDAVVTRLEVYQTLVSLLDQGLVCQLSREDLLSYGDYWRDQGQYELAAKLYRRALNIQRQDLETQGKLGSCLEFLGSSDEAAACYNQLAISWVDTGDVEKAIDYARNAVKLLPNKPFQHLTLVRCHLMRGDQVAAVEELKRVVSIYLQLGQLEDARGTCLKILDISRNDEFARRELSKILSQVENDQQSEDVIVCIQCGTVNHREATHCTQCKASLQLTCLSCHRVVAVSDRLCIFCGAHPHAGAPPRRAGGSPTTSRIINKGHQQRGQAPGIAAAVAAEAAAQAPVPAPSEAEPSAEIPNAKPTTATVPSLAANADPSNPPSGGGTAVWRRKIEEQLTIARTQEEAGNLDLALTAWREVAKIQVDNVQLLTHIKELETRVNQEFIEINIDLGHRRRRTRHYWQAARAYKAALRAMRSDDPRAKPVLDALARTEHDQRRIGLVYGVSILVLAIGGVLAMRPYYQSYVFTGKVKEFTQDLEVLTATPLIQLGPIMGELDGKLTRLGEDADKIRGPHGIRAHKDLEDLRSSVYGLRQQLAASTMGDIEKCIANGQIADALGKIDSFKAVFGGEFEAHRLQRATSAVELAKRDQKTKDDDRSTAPERFAAAQDLEAKGRLADALEAFRRLSRSVHPEIAAQAKEAVSRLAPQEIHAGIAWNEALALAGRDLNGGLTLFANDAFARSAVAWNHEGERLRLKSEIEDRIQAAEQAWKGLSADSGVAALERYLTSHPGSPFKVQAETRLNQAKNRLATRDQKLAEFTKLMEAKQYQSAWMLGRDLSAGYASVLEPGQMKLPLWIESQPSGATVAMNGTVVGRTPLLITYASGATGELTIGAAGWVSVVGKLQEVMNDWHLTVTLTRQPVWKIELGKPVTQAGVLADKTVLLAVSDGVLVVDATGKTRWRQAVAGDDLGGGRNRLNHLPAVLPDGSMALGLPGKDLGIIDNRGLRLVRIPTNGEIRGRPIVFTNDVYGPGSRLAYAGEAITTGPIGGPTMRLALPSPAISGPLSIERGLDRLLVVGTVNGQLLGMEESPKATAPVWKLNLQASDIGQLVPVGEDALAVVLDGSRLAMAQIGPEGASVRWSQALKYPAIGDPQVLPDGTVLLATGRAVVRFSKDGDALPSLVAPGVTLSPVSAAADLVAVGTQEGLLAVWKNGQPLWATPCGQPVTAVAVTPGLILAGLADGTVVSFLP